MQVLSFQSAEWRQDDQRVRQEANVLWCSRDSPLFLHSLFGYVVVHPILCVSIDPTYPTKKMCSLMTEVRKEKIWHQNDEPCFFIGDHVHPFPAGNWVEPRAWQTEWEVMHVRLADLYMLTTNSGLMLWIQVLQHTSRTETKKHSIVLYHYDGSMSNLEHSLRGLKLVTWTAPFYLLDLQCNCRIVNSLSISYIWKFVDVPLF